MKSQLKTGKVPITENLDIALRHLRYEETPRYLWIDALCINQANEPEKSKQVANMGTAFKKADHVIAWLGPKENNSDLAMALFHVMGLHLDVDWETDTMRLRRKEGTGGSDVQQEQEIPELLELFKARGGFPVTSEQARAVDFLFSRPYFERAWIAQEIRLASHVFFQCGKNTISEKHMWVSTKALNKMFRLNTGVTSSERWCEARRCIGLLANARMQRHSETIFTLRQNLGHLLCKDARDKIYSVLGLMDPSIRRLTIVPSYSQPTEQVYTNIARCAITQWSELEILKDCELSSRVLKVPSWVPDWSTPAQSKDMGTVWSACAYVAGRPSFDDSGLQCTVSGVFKSRIIKVGNHVESNFGDSDKELWAKFRSLRPVAENLDAEYLTGETLLEVYCRIFVWNTFQKLSYVKSLELLKKVWCEDDSSSEHNFVEDIGGAINYFRWSPMIMRNRRCFSTSSGHLGLGPAAAQVDDVVCVLLGCRYPIVLRPAADGTYQVVGICYTHGLMNGEIVYNNKHTKKSGVRLEPIDPETGRITHTYEGLLEKAGLRVDSKQRECPWACSVSDESLQAAGIQVEDFVLV